MRAWLASALDPRHRGRLMMGDEGAAMGEFEAVGDAVTGGVIARAVEPKAGEPARTATRTSEAASIAAPRWPGDYCHRCGQQAHVHRTLRAFGHDLLHGVLHFEGKIWRTLPLLAWRPGELTRRYIDGERAKFVSPIALFLFIVFLMFAVMGLTGGARHGERPAKPVELRSQPKWSSCGEKITELEADRAEAVSEGRSTAKIDDRLTDARAEVTALEPREGRQRPYRRDASVGRCAGVVERLPGSRASANPELVFYKLKTNAYKFCWVLIPISVPFVWLLFRSAGASASTTIRSS